MASETKSVKISEIKIGTERRTLHSVQDLADSISTIGLLNPVTVSQDYTLIAGQHRLEAAKLLGWTEIECNILPLDGLCAALAEIDENLVRTELSELELAETLQRRKEIYETLYPQTKAGTAQATAMHKAMGHHVSDTMSATMKSFSEDTASRMGVNPRTIERKVQIVQNLPPEAKELLKDIRTTQQTLLKISQMEPEHQRTIAYLLASGTIQSVEEYQPGTKPAPQSPVERAAQFMTELKEWYQDFKMIFDEYDDPIYDDVFKAMSDKDIDCLWNISCGIRHRGKNLFDRLSQCRTPIQKDTTQ